MLFDRVKSFIYNYVYGLLWFSINPPPLLMYGMMCRQRINEKFKIDILLSKENEMMILDTYY